MSFHHPPEVATVVSAVERVAERTAERIVERVAGEAETLITESFARVEKVELSHPYRDAVDVEYGSWECWGTTTPCSVLYL
jgi:hypothetical protein